MDTSALARNGSALCRIYLFLFLFGRKIPHYLQDVFSTGFFYGGDRGNRNFNQIGNSLYSVIHFCDEHFIAVCKNERYRMALLESDKPFNVFLRDATFINGLVAGGKTIASVYGDIPVKL